MNERRREQKYSTMLCWFTHSKKCLAASASIPNLLDNLLFMPYSGHKWAKSKKEIVNKPHYVEMFKQSWN